MSHSKKRKVYSWAVFLKPVELQMGTRSGPKRSFSMSPEPL
jgi:hypothetical protein